MQNPSLNRERDGRRALFLIEPDHMHDVGSVADHHVIFPAAQRGYVDLARELRAAARQGDRAVLMAQDDVAFGFFGIDRDTVCRGFWGDLDCSQCGCRDRHKTDEGNGNRFAAQRFKHGFLARFILFDKQQYARRSRRISGAIEAFPCRLLRSDLPCHACGRLERKSSLKPKSLQGVGLQGLG